MKNYNSFSSLKSRGKKLDSIVVVVLFVNCHMLLNWVMGIKSCDGRNPSTKGVLLFVKRDYGFGNLVRREKSTWRIMKQAQLKQPIVIIIEPLIVCWRLISPLCCWLFALSLTQNSSKIGPFISVIIMAPPTVAMVPTILAWLLMLLILTFSSLKNKSCVDDLQELHWERERLGLDFCLLTTWGSKPLQR